MKRFTLEGISLNRFYIKNFNKYIIMTNPFKILFFFMVAVSLSSCVTKKKFIDLQSRYDKAQTDLVKCGDSVQDYKDRLAAMARTNQENETSKVQSNAQITCRI